MDSKLHLEQGTKTGSQSDYTTPRVTDLGKLYDFTLGGSFAGPEPTYQSYPEP